MPDDNLCDCGKFGRCLRDCLCWCHQDEDEDDDDEIGDA